MGKGLKITLIIVGILLIIGFGTFGWAIKEYNKVVAMDRGYRSKMGSSRKPIKTKI